MKLAIMQPYFFPYLGYFQLIQSVEYFMFFDDVQYQRKSWMGRNRLLDIVKNEPFYIRPGIVKPAYKELLQNVKLEQSENWKEKILAQLRGYSNNARYFKETYDLISEILKLDVTSLVDFNIESTIVICDYLSIETKFDRYSAHDFWFKEKPDKGGWSREIATELKATHYINAPGGEEFIFPEEFTKKGMKLGFICPNLKEYYQAGNPFTKGLSIIDLLMFNGIEKTKEYLQDFSINWKN